MSPNRNTCLALAIIGCFALAKCPAASAQASASAQQAISHEFTPLAGHVPAWAAQDNFVAPVAGDERLSRLTLVLARHSDRQKAFEKLLADQQDPASPEYHRWLNSDEVGERFGLSTSELGSLTDWLESEGLHVDWVAPARNFIGFSGGAGDIGRAFHTALNYYNVNGDRRMSVATSPMLPLALASHIKAISGLYTVRAQPSSHALSARSRTSAAPEDTLGDGFYLVGPADFRTIYDVPSSSTGKGVTIGIAGRAHTNFADYAAYASFTGVKFANPTEVVPTAYGGLDPGKPYTTPQTQGTELLADQVAAEGDVETALSEAPDAHALLVVSALYSKGQTDGLHDSAQYLVQSKPVPAQIMVVSYHLCEAEGGGSEVSFWESIFSQAAAEGISAFAGSGDGGPAGCDDKFQPPPSNPFPISINSVCSSGYVTCTGGTGFNDVSDPSKYWSSSNGSGLSSALSYIPEGAWNEPYSPSTPPQLWIAASGGGVSSYISTPAWQMGTGVPAARTGRYTPDVAFGTSIQNGRIFCFAATGETCSGGSLGELTGTGGSTMGGIAALLVEQEGGAQGNLNPHLYEMAATSPAAFHDITVATSGVSSCTVKTPSMCNNSVASPTALTGGQTGFMVGVGYDEATGLGSLDVGKFLEAYTPFKPPAAKTSAAASVTAAAATLTGTLNPDGQSTQYWFLYGTSSTLSGAAKSAVATASGSASVAVNAKISSLVPGTKYYFQLQASSVGGAASGAISSFVTKRASQTITFKQPVSSVQYGVAPIALTATSSSGLPVVFKVTSGPGKIVGATLKINGAGTVIIAATQPGNASYTAAIVVSRSILVKKALLTVTAKNESMTQGGTVPSLSFSMSGFVNGDSRYSATEGKPALSTTATSSSAPGQYPITIGAGTGPTALTSTKYSFKFVDGKMTVNQ